jgi:ribosomal protein S12 methylthiotransferase accessory factor YcaO
MAAAKQKARDYPARLAELDAQTAATVALGEALKARWGDELLAGEDVAETEKALRALDLERDAIEAEKAAAHRAIAALAAAEAIAARAADVKANNAAVATAQALLDHYIELCLPFDDLTPQLVAAFRELRVAHNKVIPAAADDVPDRRDHPDLPSHLLAASVAGAPRGGRREIAAAAEARAKLAALTQKFLIDQ